MKLFYKIIPAMLLSLVVFSCTKEGKAGDANLNASETGQAGSLSRFTIVGDFLYAVDNHFLYSYDITDMADPVMTHSSPMNFDIETIYPFKNWLFIGTRTGLYIYSIDNPSSPVKIGEASHARSCDPVVANDGYAFATLKGSTFCGPAESGLYVHDISNIFNPVLVKTVPIGSPEGLGLQGDILYICCNSDGLKLYDISQPTNPVLVKTVTGEYFKDVIPYGDLLICYVSSGIVLYDISDPRDPTLLKLITN